MKTNMTFSLAVAVVAAISSLNLNAAVPAVSPRGAANQIHTSPGATENHLQRELLPGSPKGREMQARVVTASEAPARMIASSSDLAASPRAMASFPWLAELKDVEVAAPVPSHSCCKN